MHHDLAKRTEAVRTKIKAATFVVCAASLIPFGAMAGNGNNNGNNGNGQGNANNNGQDNGRGAQNRSPRGEIASGLRSLNAAHANENAFLNAAPNSTVGQLQTYRTALIESSSLIADQNTAAQELLALQNLTEDDYLLLYPDGDYEAALADATQKYRDATDAAQDSEEERQALLASMTQGRTLTADQMNALHEMLGF